MRTDCTPDAEIPLKIPPTKRKYTGPPKGSQEAKDRMARVRAAQWAKNGLVVSGPEANAGAQRNGGAAPPPASR